MPHLLTFKALDIGILVILALYAIWSLILLIDQIRPDPWFHRQHRAWRITSALLLFLLMAFFTGNYLWSMLTNYGGNWAIWQQ